MFPFYLQTLWDSPGCLLVQANQNSNTMAMIVTGCLATRLLASWLDFSTTSLAGGPVKHPLCPCLHVLVVAFTHHHRRFLYFCHPHPKHHHQDNQVWPNVSHVPLREDLHPRRLLLLCLRLSWATVIGMTMMRLWRRRWWWWWGCLKITIMNIVIMVGMVILYYDNRWWLSLSGLTTPPTAWKWASAWSSEHDNLFLISSLSRIVYISYSRCLEAFQDQL